MVNLAKEFCDVTHYNCEEKVGLSCNFLRHYNASQCKELFEKLGWDFSEYKVITTIRNPWDIVVSAYHYRKDVVKNEKIKNMSFNEYLDSKVFKNFCRVNCFYAFAFEAGKNLISHTLLTETLGDNVKDFCSSKLSVTVDDIEIRNKTVRKPCQEYYDEAGKDLISENFKSDIIFVNYEF